MRRGSTDRSMRHRYMPQRTGPGKRAVFCVTNKCNSARESALRPYPLIDN